MSKLTVYLDNADYSKFSNPIELSKNPALPAALAQLRGYLSQDIIEVRYSSITIAELVHLDSDSKPYAIGRAKLLRELTRTNAFVRPDTLHLEEAIHLALQDKTASYAFAAPDDWAGFGVDVLLTDFGERLKKDFQETLRTRTGLSRNDRRLLQKQFLTPDGKLTEHGIQSLIPHWEANPSPMDMPIFEQGVIDYYCGRITKRELDKAVKSVLNDVECLVAKALDYSPTGREQFIGFIRSFGSSFFASILNLQDSLRELEKKWPDAHKDKIFVKWMKQGFKSSAFDGATQARRAVLEKMYADNVDTIKKRGINRATWEKHVVNSKIGELASMDTLLLLTTQAAYNRLIDKTEPEMNDFRDFYHACYAPYCDIFSADKRTANLFRAIQSRVPALQNTTIVKSPEELISAIEKRTNEGLDLSMSSSAQ